MMALVLLVLPALLLTYACLAPLARLAGSGGAAAGGTRTPTGRREAALALHRRQLDELARDLGLGLVARQDAGAARLEIERRLLAEAAVPEPAPRASGGRALRIAALTIPLAAAALYLLQGHPLYAPQPLTERMVTARHEAATDDAMIGELRAVLGGIDPHSEDARQGDDLLAGALAARGRWAEAAAAWNAALSVRFDAGDAFRAAEAETRAAGRVTPAADRLFRAALDAGPADAPWRPAALARLAGAH